MLNLLPPTSNQSTYLLRQILGFGDVWYRRRRGFMLEVVRLGSKYMLGTGVKPGPMYYSAPSTPSAGLGESNGVIAWH